MSSFALWLPAVGPLLLAAVGAVPAATANRMPGRMASAVFAASAAACVLAVVMFGLGLPLRSPLLGHAGVGVSVAIDALSAIMFTLVAFVGTVVARYSRNYLDGDPNHGRFLKWLALTIAAVLLLIAAGNMLVVCVAWIATSLCLNQLLLFYRERPAAVFAARKKFVVSRIGDACLLGAAVLTYQVFGTLDHAAIAAAAADLKAGSASVPPEIGTIALLLAAAACLKSAQFPLHGWLLEVMETPTPVSALLHAGLINAGGFLLLRYADLISLSGITLEILVVIGAVTALFGSVVMLTQTSIKVSLAYSTVAQMGFMVLQCGLGAYSAALLHIVAHSLYKAHAFLSSGSVIDLARASWTPSPGGQPHQARIAIAVVIVLAAALGVAVMFDATPWSDPGAFILGAIVLLGLTHLMANAIDERPSTYVIGRCAAAAVGVAVVYFSLQAATAALTVDSLPPNQPLRGAWNLILVGVVLLGFAAVTVLQSLVPRQSGQAWWHALYVHLSHGLYVNTLANRLVLRLWPGPAPRPIAAQHTNLKGV